MKYKQFSRLGFTLIELLVVIAVIGLLASVVMTSLNSARGKSRDARRLTDVRQIQTALELYFNEGGGYPSTLGTSIACSGSTFMNPVPTNPTPGGSTYTYAVSGSSTTGCGGTVRGSYTLTFTLENATGSLSAGLHTADPAGIR